ncbi:DUF4174 domain-containing protein [Marinigracilibium pacificum]|uniref:DUF4174 domain-containing protein n=1 Tax=Marinigracilibium pacificum TaxID=2729599 RepID=A0A848JAD3_9BACT|nr:DUF4174 domain-containing protein [Marinigracilibium pacificum]NMM50002.1 DUF4174 domain-containing protein [Marinigracilibium pacificum]
MKTLVYLVFLIISPIYLGQKDNLDKVLKDAASKNRILVIAAEKEKHSLIREQYTIWKKDTEGFKERDLIIIIPSEAHWMIKSYPSSIPTYYVPNKKLIQHFELDSGQLSVVLIGKDTGIKDISHEINQSNYWFDLIDKMPMRKTEMNNN